MACLNRTVLSMLAVAVAAAALTGCVRSEVNIEGDQPNEVLLGAIQEGVTTEEQLVESLGPPAFRRPLDGGGELLVYDYQWRETTQVTVPLVYHKGDQETHLLRLTCQVKEGVVVNCRRQEMPAAGQ